MSSTNKEIIDIIINSVPTKDKVAKPITKGVTIATLEKLKSDRQQKRSRK